jgi:hypothetical protein
MLKQEIIKYLENPSTLNDYSMSELSALIRKYPFFQTAYSLFVLNLKNIDDPRFREYLEDYSVFIKDRARFFQHLNILESYAASYFEGIKPKADPSEVSEKKQESGSSDRAEKTEEKKEEIAGDSGRKPKIVETEKKEFSTEYLRSRIARTLTQQRNEADTEKKDEDQEVADFFILDKADELTERVAKKQGKESEEIDEEKTSPSTSSDETFELEDSQATLNKEEKEVKKKKPSEGQYFIEEDYSPENKQNKDLIDRFLENNPEMEKIEPKGQEKGEDISEESVKENEDFFTEKLAILYTKQGHFEKAIDAYQKLSLKYPEKSDYFAEQIERVKQINSEQ